ncbi:polyphosphate polymerase domain-containing protein [Nocardioides currus]|uniref:Molecular chaperone n=1 Tax=Nocardioides currus TaxID=2133958 RepID=A0A2R7YY43_9ACTN|nr:polyphosphate polymerase domain-containing protein [Nocardioides currus]PUA81261.1 molecular chaperone [Nocardioides currus]
MSLDRLAPIGLAELVERASLLERVDRKYVVPRALLPDLLAAAPTGTRVLELDGRRTHGYRSVYLDTPDLASYRVAGQRRRRRWKVRSRAYLDSGGSWLEVKTRSAREVTTKVRMPHPDLEAAALDDAGASFVDASLAGARVDGVRARDLRPVLATSYDRATLLLPGTRPTRVTVDTELGWTWLAAHDGPTSRDLDRPALAIVETKGGSTPSSMDRLLWARGHRPVSISKYGVGVAALHDVPRLKWHRVLARDLGVSAAPYPHEGILL